LSLRGLLQFYLRFKVLEDPCRLFFTFRDLKNSYEFELNPVISRLIWLSLKELSQIFVYFFSLSELFQFVLQLRVLEDPYKSFLGSSLRGFSQIFLYFWILKDSCIFFLIFWYKITFINLSLEHHHAKF